MSGGGSSKPPKVQVSQGERISTQLARQQIGYYKDTFAPQEERFLEERGHDYSDRFASQGTAATARGMGDVLAQAAQVGGPVDTASIGTSIAGSHLAGAATGRRQRDDGRLEAMNVGLGVSADATKSLSDAGRDQTNASVSRSQVKVAEMKAKSDVRGAAIGAATTLASAYGTNKFLQNKEMQRQEDLKLHPDFRKYESQYGTEKALAYVDMGYSPTPPKSRNMYRGR